MAQTDGFTGKESRNLLQIKKLNNIQHFSESAFIKAQWSTWLPMQDLTQSYATLHRCVLSI